MSQRPAEKARNRMLLLISLLVVVIVTGSIIGFLGVMKARQDTESRVRVTSITSVSGTTSAPQATASAQASATAQDTLENPYPPYRGALALNDSLRDNGKGDQWEVGSDDDGTCNFSGTAYYVDTARSAYVEYCKAAARQFNLIAYQVQMTILKGDRGGLTFLVNAAQKTFYYFGIGQDGSYILDYFKGEDATILLKGDASTLIHTGLNQPNLLAVVLTGSNVALYVNMQLIIRASNINYSPGCVVGLAAQDRTHPTEVVFTDAKIWSF